MDMNKSTDILEEFQDKIDRTAFGELPISDYNKRYIANLKSSMGYYLTIYTYVWRHARSIAPVKYEDIVLVDYGGGCGFFSILMKKFGIGKVVYVDHNPDSVQTVKVLGEVFGTGPDAVISGGSEDLVAWCHKNEVRPNLIVGLDVIEHIYDLKRFFADLFMLNKNGLSLIFTTGSNPSNYWKCRKLRKEMDAYEKGKAATPNYYTKRLEFIRQNYPEMEEKEAREYATQTRGMNYKDIQYFIHSNDWQGTGATTPTGFRDAHNTCDPETGNYMERILPIQEYYGCMPDRENCRIALKCGFYNNCTNRWLKRQCASILNWLIARTGNFGFRLAPFIFITAVWKGVEK